MKRIPGYPTCFACGDANSAGLRLPLFQVNGRVMTKCHLPEKFAGFAGVAHGGIVATLLDEVMAWAAIENVGRYCVTAEMQIRYLRPVPVGRELKAWGEVVSKHRRYLLCRGQVEDAEGSPLAAAEGKFFLMDREPTAGASPTPG